MVYVCKLTENEPQCNCCCFTFCVQRKASTLLRISYCKIWNISWFCTFIFLSIEFLKLRFYSHVSFFFGECSNNIDNKRNLLELFTCVIPCGPTKSYTGSILYGVFVSRNSLNFVYTRFSPFVFFFLSCLLTSSFDARILWLVLKLTCWFVLVIQRWKDRYGGKTLWYFKQMAIEFTQFTINCNKNRIKYVFFEKISKSLTRRNSLKCCISF